MGLPPGRDAHPDEGRDPQPSHCHRPAPGRGNRRRRRDPRRGCHGHGGQAEGGAYGVLGFESLPSRESRALGTRLRQARPHRLGARDHDRRAHRRRRLQQRVRPAEPRGLFPYLRNGGRGRSARLPQADHARGRAGQPLCQARDEAALRRGHGVHPARRPGVPHRARRRRRLLDGERHEHRSARFRFRAAGQPRVGAPLPGGHRLVLADGRGEPDPFHPRRGRGRAFQRAAGARARRWRRRGRGASRGSHRGTRNDADADLVQRVAGALCPRDSGSAN